MHKLRHIFFWKFYATPCHYFFMNFIKSGDIIYGQPHILLIPGKTSLIWHSVPSAQGSPSMSQGNPSGRAHTGPQLLRHPQWSYCPGTTCPLAQQSGNSASWKDYFFNAILPKEEVPHLCGSHVIMQSLATLLPKISQILAMVRQGQLVRWQLYSLKRLLFWMHLQ